MKQIGQEQNQELANCSMNNKLLLQDARLKSELVRNQTIEIRTNYKFLQNHNGWRKGMTHVLMGNSGGGKSSVVRSLLFDAMSLNRKLKIGLWLSEERILDSQIGFFKTYQDSSTFKNIIFTSEQDYDTSEIAQKFQEFISTDMDMLVIDNLTSSWMYRSLTASRQGDFFHALKTFAAKKNIPVLIVVHTGAGAASDGAKLLRGNDVRGSRDIVILAEYFYVLQSFTIGKRILQFLYLEKHRHQQPVNKTFLLRFNAESGHYTSDRPVDFDEFKDLFKQRNKL